MKFFGLNKRGTVFGIVLLVVFFAFTADILDLREELRLLPTPYGALDSNVAAGLTADGAYQPPPLVRSGAVRARMSVEISFLHLLPYGVRAPPSRS